MVAYAFAVGVLTLLALWVLYGLAKGSWNLWKIIEGTDGRPSTSKFQWFLWTAVVIFSYVAVAAVKVRLGHPDVMTAIPENLLWAMGFATATAAGAKAITTAYKLRGQIDKPSVAELKAASEVPHGLGAGGIIEDDEGRPDLTKIQMVAWTLVAIAAYLINLGKRIAASEVSQLPDIDSALMALMGVGQGGYLGWKLASVDAPKKGEGTRDSARVPSRPRGTAPS